MSDEELRRRLREIPAPTTRLDVDAAIAGARRTRRPKVAAVTAAAAGAGILIMAPFVAPALSPIAPSGSVMSGQGAEDAGAPAEESGESAAGGSEADSRPLACGYPALVEQTGLRAAFLDDPSDGVADLEISGGRAGTTLQILGVAVAQVAADGDAVTIVSAPDPAALEGAPPVGTSDEIAVVGPMVFRDGALLDAPDVDCGVDAPSAPAPLLLIEFEGRRLAVVGDAFGVR